MSWFVSDKFKELHELEQRVRRLECKHWWSRIIFYPPVLASYPSVVFLECGNCGYSEKRELYKKADVVKLVQDLNAKG